jgi:hypothetical protein
LKGKTTFKGMSPVTYFCQLAPPPSPHHFPIIPLNYESISGLIIDYIRGLMIQSLPKCPSSGNKALNT